MKREILLILLLCILSCSEKSLETKENFSVNKNKTTIQYKKGKYVVAERSGDIFVKDEDSLLFWEGAFSESKMNLETAVKYCEKSTKSGYSDWRLPEIEELRTIVDRNYFDPASNFPGIIKEGVWSSSEMYRKGVFFRLNFYDGTIYGARKNEKFYVFCARSENTQKKNEKLEFKHETINEERVLKNDKHRLKWTLTMPEKVPWEKAVGTCINLNYGNSIGWRLPEIEEIETLINYKRSNPVTDFPEINREMYWSSTVFKSDTRSAWSVSFLSGMVEKRIKKNEQYFMCVKDIND